MYLKSIALANFRSWENNRFDFSPQATLLLGPNGAGKTNILEAIWFLARGGSFRAQKTAQVITWTKSQSQIKGRLEQNKEEVFLGITLTEEGERIKKTFIINHRQQTRKKFLQNLPAVIFRPEDIRLATGSPGRRRRFLDDILLSFDWQYYQSFHLYQRALRQRNKLLALVGAGKEKGENLPWDRLLAENGQIITKKRRAMIFALNGYLKNRPLSSLSRLQLEYRPSPISLSLLAKNRQKDILRKTTGIGPQKDDFRFINLDFPANKNDAAFWSSRGQQRLAVLALKLAEKEFIENKTKKKSLILLDDIFSELDKKRQTLLCNFSFAGQLIVASAQPPKEKFWQKKIILGKNNHPLDSRANLG